MPFQVQLGVARYPLGFRPGRGGGLSSINSWRTEQARTASPQSVRLTRETGNVAGLVTMIDNQYLSDTKGREL